MEKIKQQYILGTDTKAISWQDALIIQLDEMVDSFLDFPDSIPQTFRDYQFARHLLWKLCDRSSKFKRLFMRGAKPKDLDRFWIRLLPYITGDLPEDVSFTKPVVIRLSLRMYDILHDVAVDHVSNFDRLLDQVVALVRELRSFK